MTAFYDRMDGLATRLLTKFGKPATLRRATKGKVNAEGKVTPSGPTDYPGLAVVLTSEQLEAQLNQTFDRGFVFKGPQAPRFDDLIIHASTTWKVVKAKQVSPEGDRIIVSFVGCTQP